MAKDEIYLTRKEAAATYRVHESTIFRWRQQGIITAYGIQGKVLYKKSELDGLLIQL